MSWLVPLCLWLGLLAIVTGVFLAAVRNARTLRRDLNERRDAAQASLEKQANALADELLAHARERAGRGETRERRPGSGADDELS
jgi:hypothetical protein